ncbi:uncharacterized protein LOC130665166 isoform X2 [Microplitis mediator]|uniref:uncharacterized protein LOC130665166 isoform X2 n=1 Tax=Microplitis mediator TaxID=375433 RepID=UPI002556DE62|nr:uncharacterized protein LOC130665166 isoform X2 [Microplitis mediator]
MPHVKYIKPVLTPGGHLKTTKDGRFCLFVDTRSLEVVYVKMHVSRYIGVAPTRDAEGYEDDSFVETSFASDDEIIEVSE